MTQISVRATEPGDLEAVTQIMNCPGVIRGTLQLPFRSMEGRRERFLQFSPDLHRFVAEVDGRVVGTSSVRVETPARRRHCGSIGMAVHDDFVGMGVGSALMRAMIELADEWLNLRRIELSVYSDNPPAIHLYEKFGFEIEGTARAYAFRDGRYMDSHYMARVRLTP